jgi:hypothetical protein
MTTLKSIAGKLEKLLTIWLNLSTKPSYSMSSIEELIMAKLKEGRLRLYGDWIFLIPKSLIEEYENAIYYDNVYENFKQYQIDKDECEALRVIIE